MMRSWIVGLSLLFGFVALALITWWVGPKLVLLIHAETLNAIAACTNTAAAAECASTFGQLGQTGDLFGAISSLFSGLALIGVALTIWIDASSRRTGRKPLIVSQISDDRPVTFDEPNTAKPRAIRVGFDLEVQSLNDVAVNIEVAASISSSNWTKTFGKLSVPLPLAGGGGPQTLSLGLRLDENDITGLVEAQKHDGYLTLQVTATAESLEGVKWETSVDFLLRFRQGDTEKIEALAGEDAACQRLWADQAIVQADHSVKPGTWRHKRVGSNI